MFHPIESSCLLTKTKSDEKSQMHMEPPTSVAMISNASLVTKIVHNDGEAYLLHRSAIPLHLGGSGSKGRDHELWIAS